MCIIIVDIRDFVAGAALLGLWPRRFESQTRASVSKWDRKYKSSMGLISKKTFQICFYVVKTNKMYASSRIALSDPTEPIALK